jgi:hypothetical protein
MGIFKVFIYTFGGISSGLFIALRLGKNLELSCRHTGRVIGLFYLYIKVILFNLKPKTQEPGELIRMMRNINQQSHAFTRELQENLSNSKKDLGEMIPALKSDYLAKNKKEISSLLSNRLSDFSNKSFQISSLSNMSNADSQETKRPADTNNSDSLLIVNKNVHNNENLTSKFKENIQEISLDESYSSESYLKNKRELSGTELLEFSLLERRKIIKTKKHGQKTKKELF